ncbi:MAG: hypothetical protein AAF741_10645 [Bacteroidota bacterium]
MNITHIQNNCGTIFIKTNVHFFLDDNCEGITAGRDSTQGVKDYEAFHAAEDLIISANDFIEVVNQNSMDTNFQWNAAYWGAPVTDHQCIPFQFVLEEVYIHCNDSLQLVAPWSGFSDFDNANLTSSNPNALDVFVTNLSASDGVAEGLSSRRFIVENFDPDNFVHEYGHCANLNHTHVYDGCMDTWDRPFESYIPNPNSQYTYYGDICWNENWNEDVDGDGNKEYLCDISDPLVDTPHPCCSPNYQNNNVMTYGVYGDNPTYAAFTPCQIGRTLTDIKNEQCDMIAGINLNCPPPSAFIGVVPRVDPNQDCNFILELAASMNDDTYKLDILVKDEVGNYQLYHTTGTQPGPAVEYRMAVRTDFWDKYADLVLLPGREYKAVLEVIGPCGITTDSFTYEFDTNSDCTIVVQGPTTIPISNVNVYPNPTALGADLSFDLAIPQNVELYTSGMGINGGYLPPTLRADVSGQKAAGTHTINYSENQLVDGVNYITIVVAGVTYVHTTLVKQ